MTRIKNYKRKLQERDRRSCLVKQQSFMLYDDDIKGNERALGIPIGFVFWIKIHLRMQDHMITISFFQLMNIDKEQVAQTDSDENKITIQPALVEEHPGRSPRGIGCWSFFRLRINSAWTGPHQPDGLSKDSGPCHSNQDSLQQHNTSNEGKQKSKTGKRPAESNGEKESPMERQNPGKDSLEIITRTRFWQRNGEVFNLMSSVSTAASPSEQPPRTKKSMSPSSFRSAI